MSIKLSRVELEAISRAWLQFLGSHQVRSSVTLSDIIAHNLVDPIVNSQISTSGILLWVDQVNGDDNAEGSEQAPYKTIKRACLDLYLRVRTNSVIIRVKSGSYLDVIDLPIAIDSGISVLIEGVDWGLVTPTSGPNSGVFTSVVGQYASLSLAGWTVNDFTNKMCLIKTGPKAGLAFKILSNTTDTLELETAVTDILSEAFEIVDSLVIVPNSPFVVSMFGGGGNITIRNLRTVGGLPYYYTSSGPAELNYGVNLGSGEVIYAGKSGSALQFKTLVAGANVTLTPSGNHITIAASGVGGGGGEANTASNVGTGNGLFKQKLGVDLEFKSLKAGGNIILTPNADDIVISASAPGEINTASNLGLVGEGLFAGKVGVDLRFKKLKAGTNTTLSSDADSVTINSIQVGEINTASNVGAGAELFKQKAGVDLEFKTLTAGSNISLTENANDVQIQAINLGEVNTASNLGTGEGLYSTKVASDLRFRSIKAGTNVSLGSNSNEITVNCTAETNTGANVGVGEGLYQGKVGPVLNFKTLVAGANITLAPASDTITIAATGNGEPNTASNIGIGAGIFKEKVVWDLRFKSLVAGSNISITPNANDITISGAAPGEVNTASNVGTGTGVFAQKSGVDLQFKTLKASGTTNISSDADSITISSSNTGEANTASNIGLGTGIYAQKVGVDLQLKTLKAGTNVNISSDADSITISSTDTGEVNTASNLGSGSGLYAQKIGADLQFKSLVAGTNISFSTGVNAITINTSAENNAGQNLGLLGEGIYSGKSGADLLFKRLIAGTNVNLTSDSNSITIASVDTGEVNTASNTGTGTGIYAQKVGVDLQFKSLKASGATSISTDADSITISSTDTGEVNTASNLGTGSGIYAQKSGVDLQFKSLKATGLIGISSDATSITYSTSAEANTASNTGTGTGIYAQKVGSDLQFKSLKASGATSISADADSITISSTDTGEVNTASNTGTGTGIYAQKVGVDLQFKSLKASGATSISTDADSITISSTDTGEVNTASNVGAGAGLFKQKSGVDLQFRSLTSGSNITINQNTDDVQISTSAEANTASNLGTGTGVYAQKVAADLQFKSLKATGLIGISSDATSITYSTSAEANTASNVGTGSGAYAQKVGSDLQFKSFKASGSVSISSDADSITYSSAAEANTASNLGTGSGVYAQKSGVDLQFKSFKATGLIGISSDATSITYSTSAEANTASNLGAGSGVYAQKVGSDLQFKSLVAGNNITLTPTANDITIVSKENRLYAYKTISTSNAPSVNDRIIVVSGSAAAVTITLPAANTMMVGADFVIKDGDGSAKARNIIIQRSSTDTIDGQTSVTLNANWSSIALICDGVSKYFIV